MYHPALLSLRPPCRGPTARVSAFCIALRSGSCATETLRGVTCLIHQAKFFLRSLRLEVYSRDYLGCIRSSVRPDAIRCRHRTLPRSGASNEWNNKERSCDEQLAKTRLETVLRAGTAALAAPPPAAARLSSRHESCRSRCGLQFVRTR